MSPALLLLAATLARAEEPPPSEPTTPEPTTPEPTTTGPAATEPASTRPARISQGLLAAGVSRSTEQGFHLMFSGWRVPGSEEATRGGLGLGWHSFGHLAPDDGGLQFAAGLGYDLVAVPWARGAVKPWASAGPGLELGMDLDATGNALALGVSGDLHLELGVDLLLGANHGGGLSVSLAGEQPVIQLISAERCPPIVFATVGLRLPRHGSTPLDRLADKLPGF